MTTVPLYPAGQTPAPEPQVPATFQPQAPVPLPAYEAHTPAPAAAAAAAAAQPPQIPEGGYAQRFVTIAMPEFNQPGIECWVRFRNPALMSQRTFAAMTEGIDGVELDENGEPTLSGVKPNQVLGGVYAQFLRMIVGWSMWDADSIQDPPEMLPSPPTTVEHLMAAPAGVFKRLMDVMQELGNPQ